MSILLTSIQSMYTATAPTLIIQQPQTYPREKCGRLLRPLGSLKATSLPTGRRQHRRKAQQRGHHCQKTPRWAPLQRNRSELSENAARGPLFRLPTTSRSALRPQNRRSQISPTPNSPIPPAQHARNEAPLWRFLTGEAQEGAVPGTPPPGFSHFPEKPAALFHVEGKTRERRRVRNASPRRKRSPPWSSKHLNAATATRFSTRSTPPR